MELFCCCFSFSALLLLLFDFPGGSDGKASVYNAGDPGSIFVLNYHSGNSKFSVTFHSDSSFMCSKCVLCHLLYLVVFS